MTELELKARDLIKRFNRLQRPRQGMFIYHNCWRCRSGTLPCVEGNPRQCEYPIARNH